MTTIWEETKAQGAKMKGRPFKEKLQYFWEYYKIPTLIFLGTVFIVGSIVKAIVTSKDYGLSIIMLNAVPMDMNEDYSEWKEDLTQLLQLDTKEYEVVIDANMSLGISTATANSEYATQQKFAALMSSKSIDILISNTAQLEKYAQLEYCYDLRDLLTADELAKYDGQIYYTDRATFADYDDETNMDVEADQAKYDVDHHDPASMKDPIPVGLFMTENTLISDKMCYAYLEGNQSDMYQNHPQEAIMTVLVNSPRLEESKLAIKYFMKK